MNNYYELIYLIKYLNKNLPGKYFDLAISPHKNVLETYLQTGSGSVRLIFSAGPNETALFLDNYRPPKKSNVHEFFKDLKGEEIVNIKLAEYDRLVYICFDNGMFLLFKLFGGSPNAFLVRDGRIVETFKNSDRPAGSDPPVPAPPAFPDRVVPGSEPKRQIMALNPLLPRALLQRLIDQYDVAGMSAEEVKAFVDMITVELEKNPHPRILKDGETCLWSEELLKSETERSFESVNAMILHAYRHTVRQRRLNKKKSEVLAVLKPALEREQNKLEQLSATDKSLARADRYEKYGHLLMANVADSLTPGQEWKEVEDVFNEDPGARVSIPVRGDRSIAENARHYYEKAKDSRSSYDRAKHRIGEAGRAVDELNAAIRDLNAQGHIEALEKWVRNNREILERYGYGGQGSKQVKSPFRKLKAGKYEIWIGKNAKSNDRLTALAHKEDLWLHARGVGGSHVVIRMGNRKELPPKMVLLEAAGYAAYYSKARGMETAPVMYTRVKYVRKPKGSEPGAVVVEREQVEMVPPIKPGKR